MENSFFSIVTPVHNGGIFVDSYVESLLAQTFASWQSIVVDDCSNDDTFQRLRAATRGDKRFVIRRVRAEELPKSFPGPYMARNIGLSHASGKFICFHDIDDYWLPNKLSDQFALVSQNSSLKLVYGNYFKMDSSLSKGYLKPRLDVLPIKSQILFCNPIPMLTSCIAGNVAKMIRFQPVGHEDYLYWREVVETLEESDIACTSNPAALYRCSINSQSRNKSKVLLWWINCYRKMGYSMAVAIVLLGMKVIMEVVEIILAKLGFFAVYLSSNCRHASRIIS